MTMTSRMSFVAIGVGVAALAGAYLAGYLPERTNRLAADSQAAAWQVRAEAAEARVRTGALLGRALLLVDTVRRRNYGQALDASSGFFDGVQSELAVTPDAALREGLSQALGLRDAVVAALAKSDPGVLERLQDIERHLRRALDYPVPPDAGQ